MSNIPDYVQQSIQAQEWDLPPVGAPDSPDQLAEAVKQKEELLGLTKSPGWSRLLAFLEQQTTARIEHLTLTVVTRENMDDTNFMRGEVAFAKLIQKFISDQQFEAQNVIDLFKAQEKKDASDSE